VAHRAETLGYVQTALAKRPVAYWNDELAKIGVPCSPINSLAQLLEHPHTESTGMIVEYEHPVAGPTKGIGQPILFNDSARSAGRPPPMHGQHTDEVLMEMGLARERIDKLRNSKIIA
jgi:crotonobetainyl-CoA:carnitine CoA-transferase CaiB-like acyl-CoA transferase